MSWRDKIAAVLAGKVGGPTPTGIHVYHSSPHDFTRFENRLLTGEGANVYGAGTYLAENPKVSGQGGQYWNAFLDRMEGPDRVGGGRLRALDFDRAKAIESAQRDVTDWRNKAVPADPAYAAKMLKMREDELRLLESGAPIGPRTYEVNFRAKPEELLDWDKPIAAQAPGTREALARLGVPDAPHVKGEQAYWHLKGDMLQRYGHRDHGLNAAYTSQVLNEAGIPGIRYLDEGSRMYDAEAKRMIGQHGSREAALAAALKEQQVSPHADWWRSIVGDLQKPQTHNYVAFDPSKLDIMAKYGVVGGVPLGAGAMGGTIDQSSYGARQ